MKNINSRIISLVAGMLMTSMLSFAAETLVTPWNSTSTMQRTGSELSPNVANAYSRKASFIPMYSTSIMMETGTILLPELEEEEESYASARRKGFINPGDPGYQSEDYPIGEPWVLLLFAGICAGVMAWRRRNAMEQIKNIHISMKQKTLHSLFLLMLLGIGLAGCKSDVKLNDITVDSKVNARLTLPIGEISANFGDLIGLVNLGDNTTITINEQGILVLNYNEHHVRDFHKIQIEDYIGVIKSDKRLADNYPELLATGIPAGVEIKPEFELNVNFSNINNSLSDERLDSLVIEEAKFITTITTKDLNITDDDIQKVEMVLGPQFRRAQKRMELPGFKLNTEVPITIDNFTLLMMADETQAPGNSNVISSAAINFVITLKTGQNVTVTANSGFGFDFRVNFIEYKALYGYFKPSNQTRHSDEVDIPIKLPGDEEVILPIMNPVINMVFTYGISIPLDVFIKDISAKNSDGTTTSALWDGSPTTTKPLNNVIPIDAPLDATAQSTIRLDKDPIDGGGIDRFFEKQMEKIAYDYELQINNGKASSLNMNQFRMTKNCDFVLDFEFTMPFEFKKGLSITYADTIKDITLERASLDSLAALTGDMIKKIEKADLSLYLAINNEIPVDLKLDVEFLDEKGDLLELAQLTDINIVGATISGSQITPATSLKTVTVKTEDFDTLAKTRNIRFKTHIGDKDKPSALYSDKKLSIKVGVTGDVEALLNMDLKKLFNK